MKTLFKILQGALIGLGAVLPGISGGVLCVIFGIYKPVMELISHPFKNFKTHVPKLIPVIIGGGIGFLGIANVLAFFLEKYPAPSVCLFVGLIAGMIPSLWAEAGGRQAVSIAVRGETGRHLRGIEPAEADTDAGERCQRHRGRDSYRSDGDVRQEQFRGDGDCEGQGTARPAVEF